MEWICANLDIGYMYFLDKIIMLKIVCGISGLKGKGAALDDDVPRMAWGLLVSKS